MVEFYTDTLMDLRIDYRTNHSGGKMDSVHYHDAYEIYILEKGERKYLIDGTLISLSAQEIALIKPFELHSTEGSSYSRYVLYFKEEYLDRYFSAEGKAVILSLFSQKKLTLDAKNYAHLIELLVELNKNHEDFLLLGEIIHIMLSCRDLPSGHNDEESSLIARIIEYLGQNYLVLTGLDELSSHFFITKSHLCRLFKRETGLSVITYVNAKKLQHATEELCFSRKSVKKIAADCGFHSSMYFCKLFRESFGLSPAEYRKNHQI